MTDGVVSLPEAARKLAIYWGLSEEDVLRQFPLAILVAVDRLYFRESSGDPWRSITHRELARLAGCADNFDGFDALLAFRTIIRNTPQLIGVDLTTLSIWRQIRKTIPTISHVSPKRTLASQTKYEDWLDARVRKGGAPPRRDDVIAEGVKLFGVSGRFARSGWNRKAPYAWRRPGPKKHRRNFSCD